MKDKTERLPIHMDVLITQPLHSRCIASIEHRFRAHKLFEIADTEAFLKQHGPQIRAIAGGNVSRDLIERLPGLEIIANYGVGYDSVDVEAAVQRNIRVTNTPDVLNDAVAEMAVALMLALARRVPQADRYVRDGEWPKGNFALQEQLTGSVLGIIGLGRIGKEIAARAEALKMEVCYHGRTRKAVPYRYFPDLVALAAHSDWLVVVAPGGSSTEGIISRAVLEALGPSGRLVNMARGSLVDQPALVEMLIAGRLGGAALDVFVDEPHVPPQLFGLKNVVLSPHQGSATVHTRNAMSDLVVANLVAHFERRPLPSPVPETAHLAPR